MSPQEYTLNIRPGSGYAQTVKVSQGDVGRPLRFNLLDGAKALGIQTGTAITIHGTKPSGLGFTETCTWSGSAVSVNTTLEMTQENGMFPAELVLTLGNEVIGTANFMMNVERSPHDENTIDGTYDVADSIFARMDSLEEGLDATNEEVEQIAASVPTVDATLTVSGAAADAKKTGDEIAQLKSDLNTVKDGYLSLPIVKNSYVTQNGTIAAYPGWDRTDYIPCIPGEKIYIENNTIRTVYARWYKADKSNSNQLIVEVGASIIIAPSDAFYYIISNTESAMAALKIRNLALYSELVQINNNVDSEISTIEQTTPQKNIINRFDKSHVETGKYIDIRNGTLSSGAGFFASDFIYIGDLSSVTVSYTHLFCWYDSDKNWLDENEENMNSGSEDLTFTRPDGAVYLRFSAYNANLNSAQIGVAVSRNNYVPYGIYNLPELRISESQIEVSDDSRIVVDASGAGDYTSFTQAIYDTVDSGIDVLVKPGTYDIVAEYVALFGQEAVDNMADADSAIFNGFQYGVRLRKRKVEFAPGSHLVCDWTGHTVDGTHRFSALGVDYNVEIIGLDLDVTATFYCIHDDYGITTPYTVKYENCRVVGHNITNANCIGGGCKKYSRHIINNCYFDNNLTGSATVRYHNTNAEGAEPEIYVSNCYFNNWFTPRWYGAQTSKMRVYVNNCHARAIYKMAESSSYDVDNVELYKWNNEETDPTN